jgi:hypothetical protein
MRMERTRSTGSTGTGTGLLRLPRPASFADDSATSRCGPSARERERRLRAERAPHAKGNNGTHNTQRRAQGGRDDRLCCLAVAPTSHVLFVSFGGVALLSGQR